MDIANTATTELARPESPKQNTLASLLESRRAAMQAVLPKHLTADRLIKIALVAASKTPKLMECSRETILQSVMTAAQLGLDCGGALGSAYLVPFKKNFKDSGGNWQSIMECQLIIGYRGMIDLARRSGQISSIETRIVYENDEFELEYGFETKFVHKPVLDRDPGKLRLVYGVAKLRDGGTQFELMTRAAIDGIKARSKSKDNGPWVTDYDEMARKTVVKRLFKYLPVSVELAGAVEEDNKADFGDIMGVNTIEPKAIDNLNSKLKQLPQETPHEETNVDVRTGELIDPDSLPDSTPAPASPEKPSDATVADPSPQSAAGESGVTGWYTVMEAFNAAAQSSGVYPEVADKGLSKYLVRIGRKPAKGQTPKLTGEQASSLLAALKADKFDFADGSIRKE